MCLSIVVIEAYAAGSTRQTHVVLVIKEHLSIIVDLPEEEAIRIGAELRTATDKLISTLRVIVGAEFILILEAHVMKNFAVELV